MSNPVDFICIPVTIGPSKTVDMWVRAEEITGFQPSGANPLNVRTYIRTKHSSEMIPTPMACHELLAQLRGEEITAPANIVLFPGEHKMRIPTLKPQDFLDMFRLTDHDALPTDPTIDDEPTPPTSPKEPA